MIAQDQIHNLIKRIQDGKSNKNDLDILSNASADQWSQLILLTLGLLKDGNVADENVLKKRSSFLSALFYKFDIQSQRESIKFDEQSWVKILHAAKETNSNYIINFLTDALVKSFGVSADWLIKEMGINIEWDIPSLKINASQDKNFLISQINFSADQWLEILHLNQNPQILSNFLSIILSELNKPEPVINFNKEQWKQVLTYALHALDAPDSLAGDIVLGGGALIFDNLLKKLDAQYPNDPIDFSADEWSKILSSIARVEVPRTDPIPDMANVTPQNLNALLDTYANKEPVFFGNSFRRFNAQNHKNPITFDAEQWLRILLVLQGSNDYKGFNLPITISLIRKISNQLQQNPIIFNAKQQVEILLNKGFRTYMIGFVAFIQNPVPQNLVSFEPEQWIKLLSVARSKNTEHTNAFLNRLIAQDLKENLSFDIAQCETILEIANSCKNAKAVTGFADKMAYKFYFPNKQTLSVGQRSKLVYNVVNWASSSSSVVDIFVMNIMSAANKENPKIILNAEQWEQVFLNAGEFQYPQIYSLLINSFNNQKPEIKLSTSDGWAGLLSMAARSGDFKMFNSLIGKLDHFNSSNPQINFNLENYLKILSSAVIGKNSKIFDDIFKQLNDKFLQDPINLALNQWSGILLVIAKAGDVDKFEDLFTKLENYNLQPNQQNPINFTSDEWKTFLCAAARVGDGKLLGILFEKLSNQNQNNPDPQTQINLTADQWFEIICASAKSGNAKTFDDLRQIFDAKLPAIERVFNQEKWQKVLIAAAEGGSAEIFDNLFGVFKNQARQNEANISFEEFPLQTILLCASKAGSAAIVNSAFEANCHNEQKNFTQVLLNPNYWQRLLTNAALSENAELVNNLFYKLSQQNQTNQSNPTLQVKLPSVRWTFILSSAVKTQNLDILNSLFDGLCNCNQDGEPVKFSESQVNLIFNQLKLMVEVGDEKCKKVYDCFAVLKQNLVDSKFAESDIPGFVDAKNAILKKFFSPHMPTISSVDKSLHNQMGRFMSNNFPAINPYGEPGRRLLPIDEIRVVPNDDNFEDVMFKLLDLERPTRSPKFVDNSRVAGQKRGRQY